MADQGEPHFPERCGTANSARFATIPTTISKKTSSADKNVRMLDLFSRNGCPPDVAETSEAYYLRRLPTAEAKSFGEHYPICMRCSSALDDAAEFIGNITVALRMLKIDGSIVSGF